MADWCLDGPQTVKTNLLCRIEQLNGHTREAWTVAGLVTIVIHNDRLLLVGRNLDETTTPVYCARELAHIMKITSRKHDETMLCFYFRSDSGAKDRRDLVLKFSDNEDTLECIRVVKSETVVADVMQVSTNEFEDADLARNKLDTFFFRGVRHAGRDLQETSSSPTCTCTSNNDKFRFKK